MQMYCPPQGYSHTLRQPKFLIQCTLYLFALWLSHHTTSSQEVRLWGTSVNIKFLTMCFAALTQANQAEKWVSKVLAHTNHSNNTAMQIAKTVVTGQAGQALPCGLSQSILNFIGFSRFGTTSFPPSVNEGVVWAWDYSQQDQIP